LPQPKELTPQCRPDIDSPVRMQMVAIFYPGLISHKFRPRIQASLPKLQTKKPGFYSIYFTPSYINIFSMRHEPKNNMVRLL